MDVVEAIRSRRSIRRYSERQIPPDVMSELLESMRLAPSSNNRQAWAVVVVTEPRLKSELVNASGNQAFVGECGAYLVGVTDPGAYYSAVDLTIALDHLSLRAVELGLGTCWVGDFDPERIKGMLGIPKDREVAVCMTLGYPAESPRARSRKPLSELFHKDRWGTPWR
ncbi:MAG: nitroreductase family protein [Thermoplasmata archaeon]